MSSSGRPSVSASYSALQGRENVVVSQLAAKGIAGRGTPEFVWDISTVRYAERDDETWFSSGGYTCVSITENDQILRKTGQSLHTAIKSSVLMKRDNSGGSSTIRWTQSSALVDEHRVRVRVG